MTKLNTMVLSLVMSKPRKKQGNPDFRHRVTVPAPESKEIESRLFELLSPGTFANQLMKQDLLMCYFRQHQHLRLMQKL